MRFEPIKTLPNICPLFLEEGYRSLVDELGVTAWHWGMPSYASELERFLLHGSVQKRKSDFFSIRGHEYNSKLIFDHTICFKTYDGPFLLTMPYGTVDRFYNEFNKFADAYYSEKEKIAKAQEKWLGQLKDYTTEQWWGQLHCLPKMKAVVVPDRFKVRKNGDFAAVIGMNSHLYYISEHRGVPLVSSLYDEQ